MLYWGLGVSPGPRAGSAYFQSYFQYFGLLERLGGFFGSAAEVMPEEQTTLAGLLRM